MLEYIHQLSLVAIMSTVKDQQEHESPQEDHRHLDLSLRHLLSIDIAKLQNTTLLSLSLNNNQINMISGLDHMPLLEHLDLSFNNISKMQGLDLLVRLKELSLYHNEIKVIEGLENCKQLQSLSLGKNRIQSLYQGDDTSQEDIINKTKICTLSSLPELQDLTLHGNPVSEQSDYQSQVFNALPRLSYLDNVKLSPTKTMNGTNAESQSACPMNGIELQSIKLQDTSCCSPFIFVTLWMEELKGIADSLPVGIKADFESICNELDLIKQIYPDTLEQRDRFDTRLRDCIADAAHDLLAKHQQIKLSLKEKILPSTSVEERNEMLAKARDDMMDLELKYMQQVDSIEKEENGSLQKVEKELTAIAGRLEATILKSIENNDALLLESRKETKDGVLQDEPSIATRDFLSMLDRFKTESSKLKYELRDQVISCMNRYYYQTAMRIDNEIYSSQWLDELSL